MDALRRLVARLSEWRRAGKVEADLSAELQSHLDFLIEDHMRRGLSPAEARRAAQLELGGLEQTRALTRDARGFRVADAFVSDVRLAVRHLRRTPGFTIAALVILALGIGANTAIFSVVDAVMLRPLPYAEPNRLVAVWEVMSEGLSAPGLKAQPAPPQRIAVSPANLKDYAARVKSFSSMAAFASVGRNFTGAGTPERLVGEEVTASYFQTLGITPAVGRAFTAEANVAGNDRVVVISDALWHRRFGGTPDVVGKTMRLGETYEIIGVMPPDFVALTQPDSTEPVSVWLPIVFEASSLTNRHEHLVDTVARLAPGASIESARAELTAVSEAMAREFDMGTTRASLAALRADQVSAVRTMLYVLLAAVGLVLLVACVNVAGLLLVRALGRRREMAVRFALGASRQRVVFEQVVQSLVLASAGGVAGLLLGWAITKSLVAIAPASMPHIHQAGLDGRVLTFTLAVVILTGVVFGAWPAMHAARIDPVDALKDGERAVTSAWVVRRRGTLLIAEVALSAILLVGALLMIRSMAAMERVELGFNSSNVLAASVALPPDPYGTPEARLKFFESLQSKLAQIPGVTHAAFGNRLPLRGNWESGMLVDADPAYRQAGFQAVSPNYFSTFGIPLKRGRALADNDRFGSDGVAVVNEAFSRTFLSGADPIGHIIRRGPEMPVITVVGVVGDVRRNGRTDAAGTRIADLTAQVYIPAAQTALYPLPLREVAVKMTEGAIGVPEAIRAAVTALDPNQPVTTVRTLDESLALGASQKRFQTSLFALFALVAFTLAIVGVYGVIAYGVSQRSAEIALRLTLGATTTGIVLDIMRRTAIMVGAGVLTGLAVALMSSRLVANLLFEIAPTDPITYGVAAAGLLVAGVAAGGLAGLRATKVNPVTALK